MTDLEKQPHRPLPGGKVRDLRADPYLKSMLLGLIEDSYLHTGTFTQFAAEVLQVIVYAVTVPVAFTEGFLKAYLSIERVVEEADGRIKIIPKAGASIEDMIRDVNEITAQVDPGAVFNPVVRAKLEAVHETSSKAMKWDIDTLSRMDDAQLMDVLREMQAESERVSGDEQLQSDESTDYVRAKIATIRRNVRRFQAQHAAGESDDADGAADGAAYGATDGIADGAADGIADGAADASPRVAEGPSAANAPRPAANAPDPAGDAPRAAAY